HQEDDVVATDDHLLGKPGIDGDQYLLDGDGGAGEEVETSRFRFVTAAVNLSLVASGPELFAELLAAVSARVDPGLDAEMEVLVVVPLGVEIADLRPTPDENAVLHAPIAWRIGVRFPSGQVLAVEQRNPA